MAVAHRAESSTAQTRKRGKEEEVHPQQPSEWTVYSSQEEEEEEEEDGYSSTASSDDLDLFASSASAAIDVDATASSLLADAEAERLSPRVERTLDLLIWSIPLSALYVLLDVMIQDQYAMHPTLMQELGRMLGTIPILVVIVWFTTIRPFASQSILQPLFLFTAVACGSAFLWTFHEAQWMQVVRQTPPLGTLWIYCLVKLDLLSCVASLGAVAGFLWWTNTPIWTRSH